MAPRAPARPSPTLWLWLVLLGGGVAAAQDPGATDDPTADAAGVLPPPAVDALPSRSDVPVQLAEFRRELRTVEEDVASLKERVFRSKATLELLKELVIDAAASGSRLVLWHVDELGGGYSIESMQYFLDGKNVYSKVDPEGSLDDLGELKLHEQTVAPGTHQIDVNLVLRGRGYQVFSYLRSYQFKLQSTYTFKAEEGMVSLLRVIADSRGAFRSFVERPTIQYEERKETFREE